jgi:hypothetical protein
MCGDMGHSVELRGHRGGRPGSLAPTPRHVVPNLQSFPSEGRVPNTVTVSVAACYTNRRLMVVRKQVCSYRGRSFALPHCENRTRRQERQAKGNNPKKLAQAVTRLTCIRELPGSNPNLGTDSACFLLATCFHAGFLLDLFFDTEDGGDMFPRNVS